MFSVRSYAYVTSNTERKLVYKTVWKFLNNQVVYFIEDDKIDDYAFDGLIDTNMWHTNAGLDGQVSDQCPC